MPICPNCSYPDFEKGTILKLVREPDNEHDGDAVAVYRDNVKVGYVVNSCHTACDLTVRALDLEIWNVASAEFLMFYHYLARIPPLSKVGDELHNGGCLIIFTFVCQYWYAFVINCFKYVFYYINYYG